mmetsp:Transcript_39953/g.87675  ORF Transcript_39953/g.87675 Transcript_39953/m.87675 type:complete len:241 (-) Transcript_39953:294-1016(-)
MMTSVRSACSAARCGASAIAGGARGACKPLAPKLSLFSTTSRHAVKAGAPHIEKPWLCAIGSAPCLSTHGPLPRGLCTTPAAGDAKEAEEEEKLLFKGGKNKMVVYLKRASILNLAFAGLAAPLLHFITSASGNGGKGIAMSAILLTFGGATTAGLNWVCSSYILSISSVPGASTLKIETTTLLGRPMTTEVAWEAMKRPTSWHPFQTFEADGKMFYLDVDDGFFYDDTLVNKVEDQLNK